MSTTAVKQLLAALLLISLAGLSEGATKFSVTTYVNSTLHAEFAPNPVVYNFSQPPAKQACNAPGICFPATNQSLKANQAYVWCGFSTTHKSFYSVTSKANLTTLLMRQGTFFSCAAPNMSLIGTCNVIASSTCDTKTKCNMRTFGLSFYDPLCIVVANNNKNATTFAIQMRNEYDSARYYGTVFILVFIAIFGTWVVVLFTWNIRREVMRPVVSKAHPISTSNVAAKFELGVPLVDDSLDDSTKPSLWARASAWCKTLIPRRTQAQAIPL